MMVVVRMEDDRAWRNNLLNGQTPTDKSIHDAIVMLTYHPDMRRRLRYNVFAKQAVIADNLPWDMGRASYPRPIEDHDGTLATSWLESQGLRKLGTGTVKECMVTVAKGDPFNPLVDWLTSLEWDGQERIENWLSFYLGAEPIRDEGDEQRDITEYLRSVGPKFLISAVARALRPGCKADCMLVLEGPQGRLKSSSMRALFGPDWFSDDLPDFTHQYIGLHLQGKWCFELAELASLNKAESNKVKAVLSRQVDRYKAPYDRFTQEHPRQCVMVGTTNPVDGYFRDPTGSRRFWPVTCGTIDLEALTRDRDQIWAEAVHSFERGDPWWLENGETDAAKTEQDERQESDPWEKVVLEAAAKSEFAETSTILSADLGIKVGDQTRFDEMRVAGILTKSGYTRKRTMVNGSRAWRFYPTSPSNSSEVGQGGGAGLFDAGS